MTDLAAPVAARRWRWRGDRTSDVQPDAGDVLYYVGVGATGRDWWHLVHGARQVRGKGPEHLWLVVTRHDQDPPGFMPQAIADAIDGGARVFSAVADRRRRR